MDKLMVQGPAQLNGQVMISKAKNAYLPIMAAVLLNPNPVGLRKVPRLRDIQTMMKLLKNLGVDIQEQGEVTLFNAKNITSLEATYDLVKTMRASICVLGPLLARFKWARVSLPGGCAIGTRPIDLHLTNLEKMGAKIEITGGYVEAKTDGLKGAHLLLAFPSVGATENLMAAAVLAEGETIIENAAQEPEVEDMANFLIAMGAKIEGVGSAKLHIQGVPSLKPATYEAIGDRIEAGTYLMAALATKSHALIKGINPKHLEFVLQILEQMGAKLKLGPDSIETFPSELKGIKIETAPYPGFPTDLQAQMMALMTQAKGHSVITEHIFENRFMHVPELSRLGAKIELQGSSAIVDGDQKLSGAPVMCTDLRASAALIIAALAAQGETEIQRIYHLERGYELLEQKLKGLGAQAKKMAES